MVQGEIRKGFPFFCLNLNSPKILRLLTIQNICGRNSPLFMTLMEDDLLAALEKLLESSEVLTSGIKFAADEMVRSKRSVEWANRVITLAESGTN